LRLEVGLADYRSSSPDFLIGDTVIPSDVTKPSQTPLIQSVQSTFLQLQSETTFCSHIRRLIGCIRICLA